MTRKKIVTMLTNLTVIIISQYIHTTNHYLVGLKLMQCYISTISQLNCKKIKTKNPKAPNRMQRHYDKMRNFFKVTKSYTINYDSK